MKLFAIGPEHKTKKIDGVDYLVLTTELKSDIQRVINQSYEKANLNIKDTGTSVVGGGIFISIVYPRRGYENDIKIIDAPFQGNISNREALIPCLNYIKEYFPILNAYYSDGTMV